MTHHFASGEIDPDDLVKVGWRIAELVSDTSSFGVRSRDEHWMNREPNVAWTAVPAEGGVRSCCDQMFQTIRDWIFPERIVIGPRTVQIDRQVSEGGFSIVYLVHDADTNEVLALKRMLCIDGESRDRARAEVRLQRSLNHPNLLRLEGSAATTLETGVYRVDMLFPYFRRGTLDEALDRCVLRASDAPVASSSILVSSSPSQSSASWAFLA